ncbi:alanine racemase [Mucisphaera sp.]|uniref:alanine racemase n=1 Tax=Mucisphaera sp. TaxID=2913024 RepID=UPI003D152175
MPDDPHQPTPDPPTLAPTQSRIQVDRAALRANLKAFRDRLAPNGRIAAVVKKDAYGLGIDQVVPTLLDQGVEALAVYSADEAEALLTTAPDIPIITLGPIDRLPADSALRHAAQQGRLEPTLHTLEQLSDLEQAAKAVGRKLRVHIYLDTGMSRSGFDAQGFKTAVTRVLASLSVGLAGLHTHLATADGDPSFARQQLDAYLRACDHLAATTPLPETTLRHVANSYASLRDTAYHLDMIRPGLGLCGCGYDDLIDQPRLTTTDPLTPVVRWLTPIHHVATYPANTPVGYGSTWTTPSPRTLAVVPIGYGDGYPVALSNKASMRVRLPDGQHLDAPVRGRVNMDQVVIDITDFTGNPKHLLGATVEAISADKNAPNTVPRLAKLAGTHSYEILCRLSPVIPRLAIN